MEVEEAVSVRVQEDGDATHGADDVGDEKLPCREVVDVSRLRV